MRSGSTLPGQDLVDEGVDDLRAGRVTTSAMLVAMARERLTSVGVEVPTTDVARPAHELYGLLAAEDEAAAHGAYNALVRRLASFARAAEHASAR